MKVIAYMYVYLIYILRPSFIAIIIYILFIFVFSFTLYPAFRMIGRGNLDS